MTAIILSPLLCCECGVEMFLEGNLAYCVTESCPNHGVRVKRPTAELKVAFVEGQA